MGTRAMRTPRWRFTIRGALVAIALLCLVAAGARSFLPAPPLPPLAEGARLRVPPQVVQSTLVGHSYQTPAPWSRGNCFHLARQPLPARGRMVQGLHVANMHLENFVEVVRRLGLKEVDVEHVGGAFLVVDPRIPRRWLLETPCSGCTPPSIRDAVRTKHADRFREPDPQSKDADKSGVVRDDQY
jgi:hypothetical protein